MNYADFLASKRIEVKPAGFQVDAAAVNAALFDWQRDIVLWSLARGRAALFCECGLGKTLMQLEWSRHVAAHTNGNVLILAPLAVAHQTMREGEKFGIAVTVCETQADVRPGINVTNYEKIHHFDTASFAGVVLDESSILKSYMGKTKTQLIESFARTPFRLCCTATPAPNDHMEIGNHAEFLGIMPSPEMLARWFINDTMNFGSYKLKGHAVTEFWDWVASWAVSMRNPGDLGYSNDGFDLPLLTMEQVSVPVDYTIAAGESLFRMPAINATTMHQEMRITAPDRADAAAALVNTSTEPWIVWCNTNYEADELIARIPDAIELRGSESIKEKERKLALFSDGEARVIISKPSICGFGLNWQHCHNAVFVGLSYSFEQLYQAIRRIYRFGQAQPVNVYLVVAETEGGILKVVQDKMDGHQRLMDGMSASASRLRLKEDLVLSDHATIITKAAERWTMHHGDCIEVSRSLPDDSIHFSIFSPPFANLYIYSDSLRDMGNSADDSEFFAHFEFLIEELYRVTKPGRLCAVHCKNLVNYKGRDGKAGLRDFRGDIIRQFVAHDWAFHSEVAIWKDPVVEMQRTKAHGLLYKQLRKDSSFSRQGLAEYLLVFRKWPDTDDSAVEPVTHTRDDFPLEMWQRYASPVWMDIQQTNVLNVRIARDDEDEKHLCPLQLDVIERAVELWTNPGDLVYSPFAGIGSEGYVSLKMGRRFVGAELKESYWRQAIANLEAAEHEAGQVTLLDLIEQSEVLA